MNTRIKVLFIITIVMGLATHTIDGHAQSQTAKPQGIPLINVFTMASTRPLASGQRILKIEPTGLYKDSVTVTIEKERNKIDGWGGVCIESGNRVNLSKYRFVTLSVKPTEVAEKLEYKFEQGPFGAAQEVRLSAESGQGGRVQLTIPQGTVTQGTNRFCVALTFNHMGITERQTLTFSDIRFWTQIPPKR